MVAQDVLAEGTTWASLDARTTQSSDTDTPLLRTTLTGIAPATQCVHPDGLRSIIAFTNVTGGTKATAQHDAWGPSSPVPARAPAMATPGGNRMRPA